MTSNCTWSLCSCPNWYTYTSSCTNNHICSIKSKVFPQETEFGALPRSTTPLHVELYHKGEKNVYIGRTKRYLWKGILNQEKVSMLSETEQEMNQVVNETNMDSDTTSSINDVNNISSEAIMNSITEQQSSLTENHNISKEELVRKSSQPPTAVLDSSKDKIEEIIEPNLIKVNKIPNLQQLAFPDIPDEPYDLIVLGSGPAGEKAAVTASQLGASVAIVEVKKSFGGPTGLSSKAVREAAIRIMRTVDQIGKGKNKKKIIDTLWRKRYPALKSEAEVLQANETRERLARNKCDVYIGAAKLINCDKEFDQGCSVGVRVCRPTGCVELPSKNIIIATGSRPHRSRSVGNNVSIPYTSRKVIDATQMSVLKKLPKSVGIIGGGVIAVEYATILASLGVKTYLLSKEKKILPFLADSLRLPFLERIRFAGVNIISNDIKSISVSAEQDDDDNNLEEDIDKALVHVTFSSEYNNQQIGFEIDIDLLLLSSGRDANSDKIDCDEVGVQIGKYGRILVDQNYKTANPNIFAIGDVIGPPGLASFAQKQASHVADLLFNKDLAQEDGENEKPLEME